MSIRQIFIALGVSISLATVIVCAAVRPDIAWAQQVAPITRVLALVIVPSNAKQIPKVHWGLFITAEYTYTPGGRMTTTKRNDLIVEQDMDLSQGFGRSAQTLKTGEYEIHIQPDNSRRIVKHFIVDNLSAAPIALRFDIPYIDDPDERRRLELVRIGPSLADLEARIQALTEQVAELKKKVAP